MAITVSRCLLQLEPDWDSPGLFGRSPIGDPPGARRTDAQARPSGAAGGKARSTAESCLATSPGTPREAMGTIQGDCLAKEDFVGMSFQKLLARSILDLLW